MSDADEPHVPPMLDSVAAAIYEAIFGENWTDCHDMERRLYLQAAAVVVKTIASFPLKEDDHGKPKSDAGAADQE